MRVIVVAMMAGGRLDVTGHAEHDLLLVEAAVEDRQPRSGIRKVAAVDDRQLEGEVPVVGHLYRVADADVEARLGIERLARAKGLELGEPVEESLFEMDAAQIAAKSIRELPGTLGDALDELEKDDVIREALGDHVFDHFVAAKRDEWDEYRTQVSDWEVERYLEQF